MRKFFLLFLLSISFCTRVFAQDDSLKKEILRYENPKAELIAKGRRLLLDKLLQNDQEKAKELFQYLLKQEDSNSLAFYPAEKMLLALLTKQFHAFSDYLPEENNTDIILTFRKELPPHDPLFSRMTALLQKQEAEIRHEIQQSDLTEIDKDFLLLYLTRSLIDRREIVRSQDSLNRLATSFLQNHPASKYDAYVRQNIRYEFQPAKWGLGFEFFTGYGLFTGDLQRQFKNNVPIGVAFDIGYKNFLLFLRDYIGFSRTKDSISFPSGIWKKGAQARVFLPEASIGYAVLDTRTIKLVPFVGVASANVSPTQYDKNKTPTYENVELKFTTTYTVGLNADIKLGRSSAGLVSMKNEQAYWFLRIRYAYNRPQFHWKYSGFDGNLHYLTVGVGGFGKPLKRVY